MSRAARFALAAGLSLSVACVGDQATTPDVGPPLAVISDGAHEFGNPDFFFLTPISNPAGDLDFRDRPFNAALRPVVEVCELDAATVDELDDIPPPLCRSLPPVFRATTEVSVSAEDYHVNWQTDESNEGAGLDPTKFYRIQVFPSEGADQLGSADVDVLSTGRELKNVATGEVVALIDGRTLPIRFRIESAALCDPPGSSPCSSETINLADGGTVTLEDGTGDRVDIPSQDPDAPVITVTLERCPGFAIPGFDRFGECLRITADPPLNRAEPLSPPAVVSLCSVLTDPTLPPVSDPRHDLVTLFRQDGGAIFELRHAPDRCRDPQLGSVQPRGAFGLARAGWGLFARALGDMLLPPKLYATTLMLDVGPSGETDFFSDFQFFLPTSTLLGYEVASSETFTVAGGNFLRSTAVCPAGKVVFGGGAQVVTEGAADFNTLLQESAPGQVGSGESLRDVWLVSVQNDDEGPHSIRILAVCANRLSGYEVASSETFTVAGGNFLRSTAVCPAGKVVFGGGAQVVTEGTADFNTRLQESAPGQVGSGESLRDVWLVSVQNDDEGSHSIRIFAVCANPPPGYEVVSSETFTVAGGNFLRSTAVCPAGKVVFGGGAQVVTEGTADFNTRLQESASGQVGSGESLRDVWLVSIQNDDEGSHSIRIFATCASLGA